MHANIEIKVRLESEGRYSGTLKAIYMETGMLCLSESWPNQGKLTLAPL